MRQIFSIWFLYTLTPTNGILTPMNVENQVKSNSTYRDRFQKSSHVGTTFKIIITCRDQKTSLILFWFWYPLCSLTLWSWNLMFVNKLCAFERMLVKFSTLLMECAVFLSSLMFLQYIYAVVLNQRKNVFVLCYIGSINL